MILTVMIPDRDVGDLSLAPPRHLRSVAAWPLGKNKRSLPKHVPSARVYDDKLSGPGRFTAEEMGGVVDEHEGRTASGELI